LQIGWDFAVGVVAMLAKQATKKKAVQIYWPAQNEQVNELRFLHLNIFFRHIFTNNKYR